MLERRVSLGQLLLASVCIAFLLFGLVWPVALTVVGGFQESTPGGGNKWTLHYVLAVFRDPVLIRALGNSVLVATCVTTTCILVAVPLAILMNRYDFRGKNFLSSLLLMPLILPPFVGAIGLRHLLGRYGAINSLLVDIGLRDAGDPVDFLGGARFFGVVLIQVLNLCPILYLNASAALANLDPPLEEAAEMLGASRWTRLRRIVLPLIRPGIFAGGTIVFIWSFTELGTPLMFDFYQVAPVQVFWGIQDMAVSPQPYALVVVMLLVAITLYWLGKLVLGRPGYAMSTRAMTGRASVQLRGWRSALAALPVLLMISLSLLPHVGVILTSLSQPGSWYRSVLPQEVTTEHFANALRHPLASGSIRNSLMYSSLALVVDLVLGTTIAYLIVRTRVPGRRLIDSLAMIPLAVPGLVLAFGYVAVTLNWPFPQLASYLSARGWPWLASCCQVTGQTPNPILFLVLAYSIRRLPYIVRSASAGLEQVSGELEEAAVNLGASPWYATRRILLPLITANLIAGGLLTFSFAMLEVSDSLILAQVESDYPLTKAIYALFPQLGDGAYIASAIGVWGMALMGVTLVGAAMLLGRKLGDVFRV